MRGYKCFPLTSHCVTRGLDPRVHLASQELLTRKKELHVLTYNITRVMNIMGVRPLIADAPVLVEKGEAGIAGGRRFSVS